MGPVGHRRLPAKPVEVGSRAGAIYFFVGGKHVDMPSDSRDWGGHRHILHLEMKSWGGGGGQIPGGRGILWRRLCKHLQRQDDDKTNVEAVHSYDAFHTRSVVVLL